MRNPTYFRGSKKRRGYFEGWYFKCISRDRRHAIALIPGMAVDADGTKHAFIQVINATSGRTYYFRFDYADFQASPIQFDLKIGGNHFSSSGLTVDAAQAGVGTMRGTLAFKEIHVYPTSPLHPGIMGPLSFIPNMECNHVIVHLTHRIDRQLVLDGEIFDFDDGIGYVEKDYGRSFPESYVWIQAGHFENSNASFVFSRANIPILGGHFPGFFAYYSDFGVNTVRFASYNFSSLKNWFVDINSGTCSGMLKGPSSTLTFQSEMFGGGILRAPVKGAMDREIIESIRARVTLRLTDKNGREIYRGVSSEAGMEISL
ncbi:MAG: hypothetical protein GXY06_00125 [Clostridiaceae bacterium]|nr:hypothetical protein [Clostridiaceae bacterium]